MKYFMTLLVALSLAFLSTLSHAGDPKSKVKQHLDQLKERHSDRKQAIKGHHDKKHAPKKQKKHHSKSHNKHSSKHHKKKHHSKHHKKKHHSKNRNDHSSKHHKKKHHGRHTSKHHDKKHHRDHQHSHHDGHRHKKYFGRHNHHARVGHLVGGIIVGAILNERRHQNTTIIKERVYVENDSHDEEYDYLLDEHGNCYSVEYGKYGRILTEVDGEYCEH